MHSEYENTVSYYTITTPVLTKNSLKANRFVGKCVHFLAIMGDEESLSNLLKWVKAKNMLHIPHTKVGVESQSIVETHFVCAVNMRIKLLPSYTVLI